MPLVSIDLKSAGFDPAKISEIETNLVATSANLVAISTDVRYIVSVVRKLAAQLDKPPAP